MTRSSAVLAALLILAATPACAHTVIEGVSGFPGGVLHPLLVPAHLLLLVALGLLAGAQKTPRVLTALFAASLIAAVFVIIAAFAFDTQTMILCLAAICGAALALNRPLPLIADAMLVAAAAFALMLDSVPALLSVKDTLAALAGTVLSAFAVFASLALFSARLSQPEAQSWALIGRRIVGSWVLAGAILVLALRFAK